MIRSNEIIRTELAGEGIEDSWGFLKGMYRRIPLEDKNGKTKFLASVNKCLHARHKKNYSWYVPLWEEHLSVCWYTTCYHKSVRLMKTWLVRKSLMKKLENEETSQISPFSCWFWLTLCQSFDTTGRGCDLTGSGGIESLDGESAARPSWCLSCFFFFLAGSLHGREVVTWVSK